VHDRDAHEVLISDHAARRIEVDPARAGNVDLNPGMGVAAGDTVVVVIVIGKMQISGYEPRGDPKRAQSRNHEHRKVATASAREFQGPDRILSSFLVPRHMLECAPDRLRHVDEKRAGVGRSVAAEEPGGPAIEFGGRGQRRDEAREAGPVFRRVGKWMDPGKIRDIGCAEASRRVVDQNGACDPQLRGPVRELGGRDMIAEYIPGPGELAWLGRDFELGFKHFLVTVIARTQHHSVLAERDWLLVVICRDVLDGEIRHEQFYNGANPEICIFRAKSRAHVSPMRSSFPGAGMRLNEMPDSLLAADEPAPVTVHNENGPSPFLIVADHAGNSIPRALGRLGVPETECERHIAWDIGIGAVCRLVADALGATLVQQNYSRLVIDCNRTPGSETSIPEISELTPVPGNMGLSEGQRAARVRGIFKPYHDRIETELDRRRQASRPVALIAMHSFTPVFKGVARPWHAGVLYNRDPRFAQLLIALLKREDGLVIGDNEPYSVTDASDYTIPVHGERRGLHHVAIEVRQDLITGDKGQWAWGRLLGRLLPRVYWELVAAEALRPA
jgi:predicted N-formylglutamate amidohydrolase